MNIPQVWLCSWCTYNYARELKILIQLRMANYVDHDVKFDIRDDPILQKSSQEPSPSSKYDYVLNALLIILGS